MRRFWRFLRGTPVYIRGVSFLAGLLLVAIPLALPLYRFEYERTGGRSVVWTPVSLFLLFAVLLPVWGRRVHGLKHPWHRFGVVRRSPWWKHWLSAFIAGAGGVGLLYGLQIGLGWGRWVPPAGEVWVTNAFIGLLIGAGVGIAEELMFRGWWLFELEQDYPPPVALWLNAVFFAIAHYLRPLSTLVDTWPQFFGLLLLGLTLVWARRIPVYIGLPEGTTTTLAFAAGLHGGLVWAYYQVDVGDLVLTTDQVPAWVTGIGGNPLAGGLGLLLLGSIACLTYVASHSR